MLLRHTTTINIPVDRNFPPVKEVAKYGDFKLFPSTTQNLNNIQHSSEQQQHPAINATQTVDYLC